MQTWRIKMGRHVRSVASGRACSVSGRSRWRHRRAHSRRPRSSRRLTRPTESSGRSKKARTPTTFRRSPRSTRTCSGSPSSPPTARSTPLAMSRPRSRSSRSPRSSRWPRSSRSRGRTAIEQRIGVDATGARFNSIIAVESVRTVAGTGAPEMNPLVNPGAISATSMVTGATSTRCGRRSSASTTTPRDDS